MSGLPSSEALWGELEDLDLDPHDPIVRLVRQVRATGGGEVIVTCSDEATRCDTCGEVSLYVVYGRSSAVPAEYTIPFATYCPNCPPKEDKDA